MNHTFPNFQHLVDRAIMTEGKRCEMEDKKHKLNAQHGNSSANPHFTGLQNQQSRPAGQQMVLGQQQQRYNNNSNFHYNNQYEQSGGQTSRPNNQVPRLPAPPNSQKTGAPTSSNGDGCYHCGEKGH